MVNQQKSAAEKLYDLITVSHDMGDERVAKFWNLENRIYSVNRFLGLIGTMQDINPTHGTDLETLANCVQKLEEKSKTRHWQKVYSNEKRKLKRHHVEDMIETLKSYAGTEALKSGKRYNKYTNKIESPVAESPVIERTEALPKKTLFDRVAYI